MNSATEELLKIAGDNNTTPQMIENLINLGADVNAEDYWTGWTPLRYAARCNTNPDVVNVLVKAGADVNAKSNGGLTALMYAAIENNPEVVNVLIKAGADVNAKDNGGTTALRWAAMENSNPEVLNILLEAGADVNARDSLDETALMGAALNSENPEAARVLIEAGADVLAENFMGITALDYASNCDDEIKRILIDAINRKAGNNMLTKYTLGMPNTVFGGEGALSNISDVLKNEGVKKLAVFTDKGIQGAGLLDFPMEYVKKSGVDFTVLNDLPPEPSYEQAQKLVDQCREYGADFILAVGGGSVMDTAKLSSLLMTGDYGIKDLLDDPKKARKYVKTLMVPTTAGTGSEATPNAIVAVPEKQLKVGIVNNAMISDYVILDAVMIKKLPRKIAAATGIDALAHCIECFTSNKANPFSDTFALEGLDLIMNNLIPACDDPEAMSSKLAMQIGSFYGGVAITASGTTAVHALSYPLGGKYHIAHGVSNAILLVPVMKFNEPEVRPLLAKVYDRCMKGNASTEEAKSKAVIDRLGEMVEHLDIPKSLKEWNVPDSDLDSLVASGMEVTRLLNNNRRKVTAEDARKIYMEIM